MWSPTFPLEEVNVVKRIHDPRWSHNIYLTSEEVDRLSPAGGLEGHHMSPPGEGEGVLPR